MENNTLPRIVIASRNYPKQIILLSHPYQDSYLDAHFAKAKNYGAKIIIELRAEDYRGRNYSCADLEGHLWSFGSYNPWTNKNK